MPKNFIKRVAMILCSFAIAGGAWLYMTNGVMTEPEGLRSTENEKELTRGVEVFEGSLSMRSSTQRVSESANRRALKSPDYLKAQDYLCDGSCNDAAAARSQNEGAWMLNRGYPNPHTVEAGERWRARFDSSQGNAVLLDLARRTQEALLVGDDVRALDEAGVAARQCGPYPTLLLADYFHHERSDEFRSLAFYKVASLLGDRRASFAYITGVRSLPMQDVARIEMAGYRIFQQLTAGSRLQCEISKD